MLLNISRPALAVAATADPVIEAIINLMPDYGTGGRLHALYVNKLQSALPGNYSRLFGTGPAFRSVFFPAWQPDPNLPFTSDTGLDDAWWRDFSVAVLCQAIAEMGSSIRGQMVTAKINADVSSFNVALRERSARAYARMLASTYSPLVTLLRQVNPTTAKQQFHDALLANVLNRVLWFQAGMWTSPDWEMFNQYAKYIALGASDAEVDTLIGELLAAGLPIPAHVSRGTWRTFSEQLREKPNVDVIDIRDASSGPITASTLITGGGWASQMPNGNCYEFTANSQPGTRYRQLPGGCCFTGDTEVLNGEGRPVPLRHMKPGDTVLTRNGTATVAFTPTPLRSGRTLYSLAGGGPVFTGTHPFLNGGTANLSTPPPTLLALDPRSLGSAVPTLSEYGIGPLTIGSILLSRTAGLNELAVPTPVTGINEVAGFDEEPYLYDLNLVTNTGVRQEFWAGQADRFFLVSPEFPVLDEAAEAATAVVAVMEGLFQAAGPGKWEWPSGVIDTVNLFGAGVFHSALMDALASTPSFGAPIPTGTLYDRIERLYQGLGSITPEGAAVVASLFDSLMSTIGQWIASLVALGWRRGMLLGGDVLALSVFDITLASANPVPTDSLIKLEVKVTGRTLSESAIVWDRCGRANTHFHHYFDQLIHLDMAGEDRPVDLSFAASIDGAPIPVLFADVPGAVGDVPHQLQSAVLRDSSGAVVGTVRFDTRRLGRDAASQELGDSGLWTTEAANAYANALGTAMVQPILWKLRELSPK